MFSCTRKDKRLSSARKRLMSQLGKRKGKGGTSSEEQSATREQNQPKTADATGLGEPMSTRYGYQESSETEEDDISTSSLTGTKVGDSLHDDDSGDQEGSVHPSSESEYFPTA